MPLSKRSLARPLTIHADGACFRNPGPAAAAAVCDDGRPPLTKFLGETTNNVAEYRGLLLALTIAESERPPRSVVIRSDSQLVVKQVSGEWSVNGHLVAYCGAARARMADHGSVVLEWVPRTKNAAADNAAATALAVGMLTPRDTWPADDDEPLHGDVHLWRD